ncbi:MAG: DUF423 domain-containing protein [Flavobacteriales bacterium]
MLKKSIILAALFGGLAVMAGAFGAHKLKEILSPADLEVWNKAVLYQFVHTFAILAVGLISKIQFHKTLNYALITFSVGVLFFSGSLYFLAFRNVVDFGGAINILGPITPLGGSLFIAGWISLLLFGLKHVKNE